MTKKISRKELMATRSTESWKIIEEHFPNFFFKKDSKFSKFEQTVFLVDGPDRSGKTSLIEELCKLGTGYYKEIASNVRDVPGMNSYVPKPLEKRSYYLHVFDLALTYSMGIVMDRSFLSDFVYDQVFKRNNQEYYDHVFGIDEFTKKSDRLCHIVVLPDTKGCIERCKKYKGDDKLVPFIPTINHLYSYSTEKIQSQLIIIDYRDGEVKVTFQHKGKGIEPIDIIFGKPELRDTTKYIENLPLIAKEIENFLNSGQTIPGSKVVDETLKNN